LKTKLEEAGLKKLGSVKRKAIGAPTMSLIKAESFAPENSSAGYRAGR
jgi:hypothetical protein